VLSASESSIHLAKQTGRKKNACFFQAAVPSSILSHKSLMCRKLVRLDRCVIILGILHPLSDVLKYISRSPHRLVRSFRRREVYIPERSCSKQHAAMITRDTPAIIVPTQRILSLSLAILRPHSTTDTSRYVRSRTSPRSLENPARSRSDMLALQDAPQSRR
jgi:hypothetical protein